MTSCENIGGNNETMVIGLLALLKSSVIDEKGMRPIGSMPKAVVGVMKSMF